jgi:tetratricopeptide (TPR) repeat protein
VGESAYVLGVSAYWLGRLEEARQEFEAALRRFRPEHRTEHLISYGQDPESFCRMRLAHTLWLIGRDREAASARDEALESADRLGHPYSRAAALVFAVLIALDQGHEERLRRYVQELAFDPKLPEAGPTRSGTEAFTGYVELLDGRVEEGVERVRGALAEVRRTGPAAPGQLGFLMRVLVEALARAGEANAGLAAADEALKIGGGTQLWEAEIRRLRAGFLKTLASPPEEVEAELARAIEVAHRQAARPFERRAREDLHRLRPEAP